MLNIHKIYLSICLIVAPHLFIGTNLNINRAALGVKTDGRNKNSIF